MLPVPVPRGRLVGRNLLTVAPAAGAPGGGAGGILSRSPTHTCQLVLTWVTRKQQREVAQGAVARKRVAGGGGGPPSPSPRPQAAGRSCH